VICSTFSGNLHCLTKQGTKHEAKSKASE
jgi:hypothetical protein